MISIVLKGRRYMVSCARILDGDGVKVVLFPVN